MPRPTAPLIWKIRTFTLACVAPKSVVCCAAV